MRKLNVDRGPRIGEGWRECFTIADDKSTGSGKSSRTDDVQVQDIFLLVKLLLQKHRDCLYRRMLLRRVPDDELCKNQILI